MEDNTITKKNRIMISTTRKNFVQKKFSISEENFERLERIYGNYPGIEKRYIFDALLTEILMKYEKE